MVVGDAAIDDNDRLTLTFEPVRIPRDVESRQLMRGGQLLLNLTFFVRLITDRVGIINLKISEAAPRKQAAVPRFRSAQIDIDLENGRVALAS